jgi:hypothetical protein
MANIDIRAHARPDHSRWRPCSKNVGRSNDRRRLLEEERTMMWPHRIFLSLATLLIGAMAFAANVETDYDVQYEFGNARYYQWSEQSDNIDEAYSALPRDNLKLGLEQTLDQTLVMASGEHKPDLLVRYYVRDVEKLVDDRPRVGIGMGGGSGGYGDSYSGGGISFSFPLGGNDLDRQAQLVIDFLEPGSQRLLWRGSLLTGMSSSSSQVNERQLNKAALEILKRFPPKNQGRN